MSRKPSTRRQLAAVRRLRFGLGLPAGSAPRYRHTASAEIARLRVLGAGTTEGAASAAPSQEDLRHLGQEKERRWLKAT